MSTPTQRERFEQVIAYLREQEITMVAILREDAYVTSDNVDEYEDTARRAGTPGRWAGITLRGGRWMSGRLIRWVTGGDTAHRPAEFLAVDFPCPVEVAIAWHRRDYSPDQAKVYIAAGVDPETVEAVDAAGRRAAVRGLVEREPGVIVDPDLAGRLDLDD